jgi:hypothetical protein
MTEHPSLTFHYKPLPKKQPETSMLQEFLENDAKLEAFTQKLCESKEKQKKLLEALQPALADLEAFDALTEDILLLLKKRLETEK